jgi:hypothetical protein
VQVTLGANFRAFLATLVGAADLSTLTAKCLAGEVAFDLAAQFGTFVQVALGANFVSFIARVLRALPETMAATAAKHQGNLNRLRGIGIAMRMIVTIVVVVMPFTVRVVMTIVIVVVAIRISRTGWRHGNLWRIGLGTSPSHQRNDR